jgi:hypothetical protein
MPLASNPDGETKMKNTIVFLCLVGWLAALFSWNHAAQAVSEKQTAQVVTSEHLSIDDVKKTAVQCLASKECILGKVLGIHQEGNSARVYVRYSYKAKKDDVIVVDLVKFNSGKWYNVTSKGFVTR